MAKQLPQKLVSRLGEIYVSDIQEKILKNFSEKRIGSFRINLLKSSLKDVQKEFSEKWIIFQKFLDFENIFIFDREFEYTIKWTRAFYDGKIYLQSIASMLPVLVLNPEKWQKILDVCAAPGSKTTQIALFQENFWKIFAIEKNQIRADKLAYNCRLQNASNVEIIKSDARKFLQNSTEFFDKILLDAPCSAEWRIDTNNEKSFGFWSEKNIFEKSELQSELLELSWKKLKKWGELVYSTCTLAPEENELVVLKFLEKNKDAKLVNCVLWVENEDFYEKNITHFRDQDFSVLQEKCIRILPSKFTEWFFIAKIMKNF